MMLGFRRRFEAPILAKTKRHTIRDYRKGKRQWKPGDVCDCYVDARQKTMRLFGRWPCVRVQEIQILELGQRVCVDDELLSPDECESLARSDGFGSFAEMMDFWHGRLPFTGVIIHWDPDRPVERPATKRVAGER